MGFTWGRPASAGPCLVLRAGSSRGMFEAFSLGEARYLMCEQWAGVQK